MSAIWKCLEEGDILEEHIHHEPTGIYAKLYEAVAGVGITLDVLLENNTQRLLVLWAEEHEEE